MIVGGDGGLRALTMGWIIEAPFDQRVLGLNMPAMSVQLFMGRGLSW